VSKCNICTTLIDTECWGHLLELEMRSQSSACLMRTSNPAVFFVSGHLERKPKMVRADHPHQRYLLVFGLVTVISVS